MGTFAEGGDGGFTGDLGMIGGKSLYENGGPVNSGDEGMKDGDEGVLKNEGEPGAGGGGGEDGGAGGKGGHKGGEGRGGDGDGG